MLVNAHPLVETAWGQMCTGMPAIVAGQAGSAKSTTGAGRHAAMRPQSLGHLLAAVNLRQHVLNEIEVPRAYAAALRMQPLHQRQLLQAWMALSREKRQPCSRSHRAHCIWLSAMAQSSGVWLSLPHAVPNCIKGSSMWHRQEELYSTTATEVGGALSDGGRLARPPQRLLLVLLLLRCHC